MPTGTIAKVYQIEGRRKPGAVIFSDGKKFSTFERGPIAAATGNEGQLAEYSTEQNGEYTNLKTLRVIGAGTVNSAGVAPQPRGEIIDLGTERLTKATQEVAAAVRELTGVIAPYFTPQYVVKPTGLPPNGHPESTQPESAVDPVADEYEKLAEIVGSAAADAQFSALRKRHKTPEKLKAAAAALLAANGVEVQA